MVTHLTPVRTPFARAIMLARRQPVTIDERIEALTQSVELSSQMHQDNEKRYDSMFERLVTISAQLARMLGDHEERIRRLEDEQG
jgi:hypothetical protein